MLHSLRHVLQQVLLGCLSFCFFATPALYAVEGMFIVTADPGKIFAGEKMLAELPKGTQVWVFNSRPGWADVRLPDSEEHGWISTNSLTAIKYTPEQQANAAIAGAHFKKYELLLKAQQYAAAQRELEQVIAVERVNGGEMHPMLAVLCDRLGELCREQGNYADSNKAYQQAVEIRRKVLGRENSLVGNSLMDLGVNAAQQSDYASAHKFYDEALAIYRKLPNQENAIAVVLVNLGNLLDDEGDYAGARKVLEEALTTERRLFGNGHPRLATTLSNLGNVVMSQGDYPAARKLYEEALALNRKANGNQHSSTASDLHNLGNLLVPMGDFTTARKMHEESLAIRLKIFGTEHPLTAQSLNSLGSLCSDQRDEAGAEKYYSEALPIFRKIHGNEHPRVADVLNNLGIIANNRSEYVKARKIYEESLAIRRKIFGAEHADTAVSLHNLATLARNQGEFAEAQKLYAETQAIYRKLLGPEHPRTAHVIRSMAMLNVAAGDYAAGRAAWDEQQRITRRHTQLVLPTLSIAEQLKFLDNVYQAQWFESLSFGWLRREDAAINNASAEWLINGKAIAQESLAARELLLRDAANPQLAAQVKELQQVRARLASLALSTPAPNQATVRQAEVEQLTAAEIRLSNALTNATGGSSVATAWITLAEVQRAIPREAVYIDLVRLTQYEFTKRKYLDSHYFAWIIPGQGQVQIVDLGEAEPIEQLLVNFRTTLAAAPGEAGEIRNQGEALATAALQRNLQAVAELVLKPLLPHLAGKTQLILSPDGVLWLLPWAALPTGAEELLVERCSVRLVLSGRDLVKAKSDSKLAPTAPAIFVNPDYDLAGPAAKDAIRALLPHTTFAENATRGLVSRSSLPRVIPLPYTSLEGLIAKPIFEQLANRKPLYYEQRGALEAVVKTLQRPQQLLFATHGFFQPDQQVKPIETSLASDTRALPAVVTTDGPPVENPLLRCGLLLAGCNTARTPGIDDGILTGQEIVGLDLRGTDLVVLSACETGIGRVRNGEGVAGLRQAFQLAGAQSVVSTLWQVPDRDSSLVMQDFFTNLGAGQSKAEALRNAQLKRIAARKVKSGAAHPFFWAAWTVTE